MIKTVEIIDLQTHHRLFPVHLTDFTDSITVFSMYLALFIYLFIRLFISFICFI